MKKLLAFILILSMATLANAITLQISVNGNPDPVDSQINICPSQELILDIYAPDGYAGIEDGTFWALVVDNAYGTITGGTVQPSAPSLSDIYQGAKDSGFPCLEPGEDGPWGGIAGAYGETAPPGIYYDEFVYHCVAEGDVIIRLITSPDFVSCTVQDTLTIHQIPEPASMLLLGLGGLLLRRRK